MSELERWVGPDDDRIMSREELNAALARYRTELGRRQMVGESARFWLMVDRENKAAAKKKAA